MRGATVVILLVGFVAAPSVTWAQRCGMGTSSESASADPNVNARKNVNLLFDGVKLTSEEKQKAVKIVADAWTALVKLDYRATDYQERFTAMVTDRNRQLLGLAKSRADSSKLITCFKELGQPVPTETGAPHPP